MKTQTIITTIALMLLTTTLTFAGAPQKLLILHNTPGKVLSIPIKVEVATDTVPLDLRSEFHKARLNDVTQNLDITSMIKPEAEVNDIHIDLDEVFYSLHR